MALVVMSRSGDLHVRDSPRRDIRPPKTGLDREAASDGLRLGMKRLMRYWEALKDCNASRDALTLKERPNGSDKVARELFRPYGSRGIYLLPPPPTYEESLCDLPPDYTATNALAAVDSLAIAADVATNWVIYGEKPSCGKDGFANDVKIDLQVVEGIREHAGKKAKQAAKKAQQAKWNESGEEDNAAGDGGDAGDGDGGRRR